MKSLKNYVILSVAIVIAVLVGLSQVVNASGTVLFPTTNTTPANTSLDTSVGTTDSTSTDASTATTPSTNSLIVNNVNTNVAKDNTTTNTTVTNTTNSGNSNLPQTGENDIYIVSAIGVVALAIGSVAYFKSRRYDI